MGANRNQNWDDLLDQLKNGQIPRDQIGSAIVKLGKPFASAIIIAAKDTVALYRTMPIAGFDTRRCGS